MYRNGRSRGCARCCVESRSSEVTVMALTAGWQDSGADSRGRTIAVSRCPGVGFDGFQVAVGHQFHQLQRCPRRQPFQMPRPAVVVLNVLQDDSTVRQHHEPPTGFVHNRDVSVLLIGLLQFVH